MLVALLESASLLVPREALASGDPSLEAQVAALRPLVRAVVAAVLREPHDHPDVEDATQETLRRAVEGRSRPSGPVRPWLLGVARHVALDLLRARRRARARQSHEPPAPESGRDLLVERLADPQLGADEAMLETERRERVARALSRLPEGPRRAVELFHVEGLRYGAIAERLGVPLGTVATWVTRGRKAIADAIADEAAAAATRTEP